MNIQLRIRPDAQVTSPVSVEIARLADLEGYSYWKRAFAHQRKDYRYFAILEETLNQGFDHRYFVVKDPSGTVLAIQPFFLLDQSVLAGIVGADKLVSPIRKLWPRFLQLRALMIGNAAGEGHIDAGPQAHEAIGFLAHRLPDLARSVGADLIVLKEFPSQYRASMQAFKQARFQHMPSMPMTKLALNFSSFDDHLVKNLSSHTRRNIRRKLRIGQRAGQLHMTYTQDVTPVIDEVFPLYLQTFQRSKLHFEKLTPQFFCRLGQTMPDKARFFLWRQNGRLVAFALCLVHGDDIVGEYLGFDYEIALNIHLYYRVTRDVIDWAILNGYKTFRSGGLNYNPKLHMRHTLEPLDLYIRHTNPLINAALRAVSPFIDPTRHDANLRKFPNYGDLRE